MSTPAHDQAPDSVALVAVWYPRAEDQLRCQTGNNDARHVDDQYDGRITSGGPVSVAGGDPDETTLREWW